MVLRFSELQHAPELMGMIYTVEGTCILLGGLLAKRWIGERNLVVASSLLVFLFAIAQFGMSFALSRYVVLSSFGLFGLSVAFFFPVTTTIFQKRLPDHTQGRFFSFKSMLDRSFFFVSLGVTGACLDLMGISWYMITLGLFTLVMAVFSMLYGRQQGSDVRQSDKQTMRPA